MTASTEQERVEFEAWLGPEYSREKWQTGEYADDTVFSMFAAWQASRKSLGFGSVELPSEDAGWFKHDKISQCWHPQYSEYAKTYAKVQGWQKLYTEQQVIDLLKSVGVSVKP